jgi:hypothetical protein
MTLVSSEDRARHRLGMRDRSTRITMHNIARGRHRWSLCKSAFTISVERAGKYARSLNCRLRVLSERCNKKED